MVDVKLPVALVLLSLSALSSCGMMEEAQMDRAELLKKMSEEGPEIVGIQKTLYESAKRAESNQQYGRAIQFYKQLLDKDNENPYYHLGLANSLRRINRLDEAAIRYQKVLDMVPGNLDALEGQGLVYLSKTDFKRAGNSLETVMTKDPQRWRTLNAVGILFIAKEMPQEALAYFEEALRVQPGEPAVLNNIGLTYALNEQFDKAATALETASVRLKEGSNQQQRADLNLALVHGLKGDMVTAESIASKHLSDAALNNNLGFYAYLADNRELAKGYLNHALSGSSVFYEKAWANLEELDKNRKPSSKVKTTQKKTPLRSISGNEQIKDRPNMVTDIPTEKQISFPDRSAEANDGDSFFNRFIKAPHSPATDSASTAGDIGSETNFSVAPAVMAPPVQPAADTSALITPETAEVSKATAAPYTEVDAELLKEMKVIKNAPKQHIFTTSEKSFLNAMEHFGGEESPSSSLNGNAPAASPAKETSSATPQTADYYQDSMQEMFVADDTPAEELAKAEPAAKGPEPDDLEKAKAKKEGGMFDFMPDSIDDFIPNAPW